MAARLRAQEEWGKWNTAPLSNRLYGGAFDRGVDLVLLTLGWALWLAPVLAWARLWAG